MKKPWKYDAKYRMCMWQGLEEPPWPEDPPGQDEMHADGAVLQRSGTAPGEMQEKPTPESPHSARNLQMTQFNEDADEAAVWHRRQSKERARK